MLRATSMVTGRWVAVLIVDLKYRSKFTVTTTAQKPSLSTSDRLWRSPVATDSSPGLEERSVGDKKFRCLSAKREFLNFPRSEYRRCLPKARGSGGDRAAPQLGAF